jgi:hypothetical protein
MPDKLQCTPELNTNRHVVPRPFGQSPGTYRGFCMRGKPDGRGEWTADEGESYAGDWREGMPHGYGKEISRGFTYWGEFSEGYWDGGGVVIDCRPNSTFWGLWVCGCLELGSTATDDGQIGLWTLDSIALP